MGEYEDILQNQPVYVSEEFARQENHFFIGSKILEFDPSTAEGLFCLPEDGALHTLRLEREGDGFVLSGDPLDGRVKWNVRTVAGRRDD